MVSVDALSAAIARHDWRDALKHALAATYGFPRELLVAQAVAMLRKYLPLFESHHPDARWVRQLLASPESPDWDTIALGFDALRPGSAGDASFLRAIDGLTSALSADSHAGVVRGSLHAVGQSIEARANEAWESSDPEAVALWRRLNGHVPDEHAAVRLRGRTTFDNESARAERQRAWREYASVLAAMPDFPADPAEVEEVWRAWLERELEP